MMNDYPILIGPLAAQDGGGFVALVPDLHGCMSDGATEEEAIANVKSAILEWIDEAKRLKRDIPEPGSCFEAAAKERAKLQQTLKQLSQMVDVEIQDLRLKIEEIAERLRDEGPYSEFSAHSSGMCIRLHDVTAVH